MRSFTRRAGTVAGGMVAIGAVVAAVVIPPSASAARSAAPAAPALAAAAGSCHLGNGVQHVINITFDNVHFFRDNPNVPSDLEQMPTLLHFLESNGTVLSNMHTPLIAHTAEDSLAIYSGLYGDRHGQPVSNTYKTYKPDGTTEADASFAYWTSPVISARERRPPTTPRRRWCTRPTVPAKNTAPDADGARAVGRVQQGRAARSAPSRPRTWCSRTAGDIPTVFGTTPPPRHVREPTSRVHRRGHPLRRRRRHLRARANGAVADMPPAGQQAGLDDLQGRCSVTSTSRRSWPRTRTRPPRTGSPDNAGNLVDLDNREIADFRGNVGFPGFSPTASQSLAELAAMQEAGVPVTYGYIADIHERKDWSINCTTASATELRQRARPRRRLLRRERAALRPGVREVPRPAGRRTASRRRTPCSSSARRRTTTSPARTSGRADAPERPGELRRRHRPVPVRARARSARSRPTCPALLQTERGNTTPFDVEPQGAAIYVHNTAGKPVSPAADDPAVRQLERDTAARDGEQPAQRRPGREDRQLPGRRDRAADPAPRDRRPAADADVHALPEAGLLLRPRTRPAQARRTRPRTA